MLEIRHTEIFDRWLRKLKDEQPKAKIAVRIQRMAFGNFGDVSPIGEGVCEIRIFEGPGYRVYFVQCGSSCSAVGARSQGRDIRAAKVLAWELTA